MLSRDYLLNRLKSKSVTVDEFNFDKLQAPPLLSLLTPTDVGDLYTIASSVKYSAKPDLKYKMINQVMNRRGFQKLSAGTNRICYRFLDDNSFVAKVAYDNIGRGDNPAEFRNQFLLKPFVTKIFEVSPCGTVGLAERVNPITSREEFITVADDIFTLITQFIIGEYVMADIGSHYFMNYGIRTGFGCVLLDFPYLFKIDPKKLFCAKPDPTSITGCCDGEIDYDDGFNKLICTKCGAMYRAKELELDITKTGNIVIREGGGKIMKINISGGSLGIESKEIIVGDNRNNKVKVNFNKPMKKGPKNSNQQQQPKKITVPKKNDAKSESKEKAVNGVKEVNAPKIKSIDVSALNKEDTEKLLNVLDSERLNAALNENFNKTENYSTNMKDVIEANGEIADENEKLKKEIEALNNKNSSLEATIDDLNKEIDDNKAKINKLEEDLKVCDDDKFHIDELKAVIATFEKEVKDLKDVNEQLAHTNRSYTNRIADCEKELEGLHVEIEEKNKVIEDLNSKIEKEDEDESDKRSPIEIFDEDSKEVTGTLSLIEEYFNRIIQLTGLIKQEDIKDFVKLVNNNISMICIPTMAQTDIKDISMMFFNKFIELFERIDDPLIYESIMRDENVTSIYNLYNKNVIVVKDNDTVNVKLIAGIPDEEGNINPIDEIEENINPDDIEWFVDVINSIDDVPNEEVKEYTKEDKDEYNVSEGPIMIHGIVRNLKDMYPSMNPQKVIIMEDNNGELVTGANNALIAIDSIDNQHLNKLTLVSTEWYMNVQDYLAQEEDATEESKEVVEQ